MCESLLMPCVYQANFGTAPDHAVCIAAVEPGLRIAVDQVQLTCPTFQCLLRKATLWIWQAWKVIGCCSFQILLSQVFTPTGKTVSNAFTVPQITRNKGKLIHQTILNPFGVMWVLRWKVGDFKWFFNVKIELTKGIRALSGTTYCMSQGETMKQ